MAIIKKFAETLTQPLSSFGTFLIDTNPNSTYFKITEFNDTFTGGKNGFLIEGSEYLQPSTEIKIQILDVNGDPIYYEPGNGVPEYYEGTSKLVAVYVYEDTPIGTAKITILGELKTYIDEGGVETPVPDEWKNVYNVKWEKEFKVNRLLSNEDKVRFYRRPEVSINEIVKPIFSNVVTPITQMGRVDGFAQVPAQGERLSEYSLPTNYLLQINDGGAWTGSVVGTTIELTDLGLITSADDVISKTDLTVQTPYTINGIVQDFSNQRYTASFNYIEGIDNLKTALTGSFAKITISDLTTFVGDVARVKIFRKSQSDLADYQFIQEIQLESNELLKDLESTTKNEEFYGIFDNTNYKNYWVTSSNNLTTTFNQNYLYNSVKLDSIGVTKFFTTQSIQLTENAEYTLAFNVRLGTQTISSDDYVSVYISGSRQSTFENTNTIVGVQQNILTVSEDSSLLQKSQITANFKGEAFDDAKLYFDIKGSDWYISDISLRASQESSFSPDEITFIQPIPRTLPKETFNFLFQFYDINNNYIPVIVEESKTFDGGNLNRINKSLELIPSSLYFQFDSGSGNGNPVNPTTIFIDVIKNFLTGSVTFTSRSFDFFNTELSSSMYDTSYWATTPLSSSLVSPPFNHWQFPGKLLDIDQDRVRLTVQNFTGSRDPGLEEITVQYIEYTAECEDVRDSIIITRVIDGKGGVNYELRPYNGQFIRNSDPSGSLEVQAIRIDGVNEIKLRSGLPAGRSAPQIHVQSGSKYLTLNDASASGFIKGLQPGTTGSGQLNYNAVFNRDSIDGQLTLYLIPTGSENPSASILTVLTLTDLQDGLDAGVVLYDADTFTINPRLETKFTPTFSSATASFYRRGKFVEPISCSIEVYPSMSINKDFVPEYWVQYVTHSCNSDISVVAYDEFGNIISSSLNAATYPLGLAASQSKQLLVNFIYTEPWTSASVSVDKLFTIVPEGKPGDESIVFEVNPASVTLAANSRGSVTDYSPSTTEIKLKQGSRYLAFTASKEPGTFDVDYNKILSASVTGGKIEFFETSSMFVSQSFGLVQLSGSITYPLFIHPYYTSSQYTQSIVQQYTKVLDGPPPIQILISPQNATLTADEVGFITPIGYTSANTTLQIKEGEDFLRYTASQAPGTWKINSITTNNIQQAPLITVPNNLGTLVATASFNRFDFPFVSASALYTIQVYPFALGSGHEYTSSIFTRTQTFTKNVSVPNARSLSINASSNTVTYDRDGGNPTPSEPIILTATAFNTTGSLVDETTEWRNSFLWFTVDDFGNEEGPIQGPTRGLYISDGVYQDIYEIAGSDNPGPGQKITYKCYFRDGTNDVVKPVRAEAQITIAGIKAGADAYKVSPDNTSTSITAELFSSSSIGTAIKLPTYKGTSPLINVTSGNYPAPQPSDFDKNTELIGILGYSSASIVYKSPWIGLQSQASSSRNNRVTTTPASMPNITSWDKPAINKSGEIVYKIDFEGYSPQVATNFINRPPSRQTEFVTQSIAVQFTEPAPYNVVMQNDNSSVVYRVSGEMEFNGTGNIIKAYRGGLELTHRPSGFAGPKTDSYGDTGYENQYVVSILSKSPHLTLAAPFNTIPPYNIPLSGNPATLPDIISWDNPEENLTGVIVYQIDCEYISGSSSRPGTTLFKTQSLSIQFEGAVGPGIVMRGEWSDETDYIGKVENTNSRRDAVIYNAVPGTTNYYAAISGSGPNTYVNPLTSTFYVGTTPPSGFNLIGARQPDTQTDYWEFLGVEEFFVAAKIAIFEESYVKNTINVGTKNGTGAFANIVIAGGRTDPYIAIGQNATVGTSGAGGTSLNPGGAVIGYERPGIFLGIYEQGASGTTGRFSIVNTGGDRYLKWDGAALEIAGNIRIKNVSTARDGGKMGAFDNGDSHNAGDVGGWELAADAIYSGTKNTTGFNASTGITLAAAGSIHSKNFYIDTSGNAFFKGDITGANGTFGGNVTVGGFIRSAGATGLDSGTSGFYMAQDGQFRFGHSQLSGLPSLTWDNNTLSIKGKIQTDNSLVSEIGNWRVVEGNFQDSSAAIVLNANSKIISISEDGVQRVVIKQGTISDPAGSTTNVTIDPPATLNFSGEQFGNGYYNYTNISQTFGPGFNVPAEGLYSTPANLNWGGTTALSIDTDFFYDGNINVEIFGEIWTSPDLSGTQISSVILASVYNVSFSGYFGNIPFNDGFPTSLYFPNNGTYYMHVKVVIEGFIDTGTIQFFGSADAQSQTFNTAVDQTELGRDGILVAANASNYVKVQRTISEPMIDIKTSNSGPGLRITNTNPAFSGGISTANAIEVTDGNISLAGAGNNFIVNGGFIGTQNTTGGIRLGTLGNNSVLMGANWPSQASNVATARLRPGTTKFGIGGRELIFDSSTLRVKTDIEDYPNSAYESIRRLRPVLYNPLKIINTTTYETGGEENYDDMYPMPNAKEYIGKQGGFIAEWLDEDPDMRRYVSYGVSGSAVTVDSLAYDKIIVPLTKTVQILMDKVEALEAYISGSL